MREIGVLALGKNIFEKYWGEGGEARESVGSWDKMRGGLSEVVISTRARHNPD